MYMVVCRQKIHFKLYKDLSNYGYAQIIFPASFTSQGVLNKDPTVWLEGDRPPP